MRKIFAMMLAVAGVLLVQGCNRNKGTGKLRIAVIPKGTTHVYWTSVHKGAQQAADALGVEIIWKGPLKENNRDQQIDIVRDFKADRVDAIVLAPLDENELARPVREATAAKIPVVIIDSGLKADVGKDFISYIATDNHRGGELAGEKMVTLLGGKGKVVLLRYMVGSASTARREEGFLAVIRKSPGIEVLSENQYSGATAIEAQDKSLSLLELLKQADGVFCPNESSTVGMLKTLQQAGLAGKIKFVGFDATPALIDALKAGDIQALVAQDPVKMGYEGVKAAVAAAKGQAVADRIDTGVQVITKENLEEPGIKKLLEP